MVFERGSLWAKYVPLAQLALQSDSWREDILGMICYNKVGLPSTYLPTMSVDMPQLAMGTGGKINVDDGVCEVWFSKQPLFSGSSGSIVYRYNEQVLFGCLSLNENSMLVDSLPLQVITELAYSEIFAFLDRLHYNAILRIWNYFTAINVESHGIERYRQFNSGRQSAFLAANRPTVGNVPTSSVLGANSGGLNIAFLAVRDRVVSVENPRQTSAYYYPDQYGPRAPIFSRAGFVDLGGIGLLFVSGTASIIGHQTVHHGNIAAQTQESINNLSLVVNIAKAQFCSIAGLELVDLTYKVYVRHPSDLPIVQGTLDAYLGKKFQVIYLQADICRADLLVEIEATNCHLI